MNKNYFLAAWPRTLALAVLAVLATGRSAAAEELKVGDPAPSFSLQGTDGKTYTNETFRGKQAVVIAWYPKAFTGGCTKECLSMRDSRQALAKFDVAYFAASTDPVERNKEFAKKLGLNFPLLSDPAKKAAAAFGCLNESRGVAKRYTYIIGADGKILHIDKAVRPVGHGEAIAAKLKELKVAAP